MRKGEIWVSSAFLPSRWLEFAFSMFRLIISVMVGDLRLLKSVLARHRTIWQPSRGKFRWLWLTAVIHYDQIVRWYEWQMTWQFAHDNGAGIGVAAVMIGWTLDWSDPLRRFWTLLTSWTLLCFSSQCNVISSTLRFPTPWLSRRLLLPEIVHLLRYNAIHLIRTRWLGYSPQSMRLVWAGFEVLMIMR